MFWIGLLVGIVVGLLGGATAIAYWLFGGGKWFNP